VIATLYASAPGIYAGLGYRTVGAMDTIEVPASALHGSTRQRELRRATADDLPEMKCVYTAWASSHDGPHTRTSVEFDDAVWLHDARDPYDLLVLRPEAFGPPTGPVLIRDYF
jgi:hypothetical protein